MKQTDVRIWIDTEYYSDAATVVLMIDNHTAAPLELVGADDARGILPGLQMSIDGQHWYWYPHQAGDTSRSVTIAPGRTAHFLLQMSGLPALFRNVPRVWIRWAPQGCSFGFDLGCVELWDPWPGLANIKWK